MRRASLVLMAAGCGFTSPGGPTTGVPPDGGIAEDHPFTTAELAAGQLVDMTFDDVRGTLTPNAYTYGGLVAHGRQGIKLWDHDHSSWAMLNNFMASGAGLWCGEEIKNGTRTDYLGVMGDPTMTLWFEGEVWLDGKATETLRINGDDLAFLELASPGSTAFTRIAENETVQLTSRFPAATTAGWYPVRIGFGNLNSDFDFVFTRGDDASSQVPWTRNRLRARASQLSGMLRTVYGRQILAGGLPLSGGQVAPPVPRFEPGDLLHLDLATAPQGAQSNNDDWSTRYLGQVYITKAGSYTLLVDSDDGNRAQLGGIQREQHWRLDDGVGNPPLMTTMVQAGLVAGWNDLVVDYNQVHGGSFLRVRLQGPDFPNPVEIPHDRLRPVERADDRLALGVDGNAYTVPDNGGIGNDATATMTVAGFSAAAGGQELVDSIELTYQINTPHGNQIKVDLETPGSPGTRVTLRDRNLPDNDRLGQITIPSNAQGPQAGLIGIPADGAWKLHVYDVQDNGGNSSLLSARLTLHTRGGPDKLARTASWLSPILDGATPVFAIDGVIWDERLGSGIQVRVRTCSQPDCSGADWGDPVVRGMPFSVTRGRYLQVRVDMTSDGSVEPELSGLRLNFRRDPP